MQTRFIFFTGGVVSSVGKGLTAAALGRSLKERGFKIGVQKLDPYLNVDPGTMSPYQHGEVFVLDDGAETDLDLGHYERFIDIPLNKDCNVTTGQVYAEVISRERQGDYLGGTIQVIPHITNEIKRRIMKVAESSNADFILIEVGGTVGDIESQPYLEAIRQLRNDVGRENTFHIHVTWLPFIGATNELKTKPTQHSVRELRSMGITPNMIIARADHPVEQNLCEKIALFCDVEKDAVIPMQTLDSYYEVPSTLEKYHVAEYLLNYFHQEALMQPDWKQWDDLVYAIHHPERDINVAIVGKYVELHDAYISVREALNHAAFAHRAKLHILWIHSCELENDQRWEYLEKAAGIVVPGGFGQRGIEGKIMAARYAREKRIPYFGLCLGMQLMVVEFARFSLQNELANSTEFDEHTPLPVIDLMPDQKTITDKGGTMRLGLYPCHLVPETLAARAYGCEMVEERHRHRYEFNNAYRDILAEKGLLFSGLSPDQRLVEIAEIKNHPFMLGTQFHPEFLSRPNRPHPLFDLFVKTILEEKE
ncbi:MAG: CTP synthase [Anaerolinea thermophila]|uniref:CTP synthase n=1 Tax=Anaerolinea thermophila TaxID=167964 RepID=A0A101FXD1_9CHLR|nr:MAG: CTP synthase [Anaerolinea thermophila]